MEQSVSLTTLIKASVAAILLAGVAFVSFILPAEYNIDPTGFGQKLGLTVLAQSAEAAPIAPQSKTNSVVSKSNSVVSKTNCAASKTNSLASENVIEITVPANQGIEYKLQMNQHDKLTYEWMTDGDPLYFDLHGEPEGDTTGYFESYAIATLGTMKGSFIAPFDGSHGWYWKNTSAKAVAIQLIVNGHYQIIGLKP